MKFLVDMPLSPELATWLVRLGHDAVHAGDIGLHRASDVRVLKRARMEQRVVVTADLDYTRLLALSQADGPGLILFRAGNYSERETMERLKLALEVVPSKELLTSIVIIEKRRIRRRRLPIEMSL